MMRRRALAVALTLFVASAASVPSVASADRGGRQFTPGAAGIGDDYFPLDGNGGYDVDHYSLDITYDPVTDVLVGIATIEARATQNLSSFNLDLDGLEVRNIRVDGSRATFSRADAELTVVPKRGIRDRSKFTAVIHYDGVPHTVVDQFGGESGFIATDDGALIVGQPDVAATWFPVNDHPSDAASYSFDVTVPAGLEAIANGVLKNVRTHKGWTTWKWEAKEPMASYLATASIGDFDVHAYKQNGIKFWDAIDPDLFTPPVTILTGERVLISQQADNSYKRLTRTLSVPTTGGDLTFQVARSTETDWDFFFVEAHRPGLDDWTTLPDAGGETSDNTGNSCPFGGWQAIHPFLAHYQTDNGDGTCTATGTTGSWNAATGEQAAWTQWTINLDAYAGGEVELSLAYASDETVQAPGVAIDDVVTPTGDGNTSFEADADPLDGWVVSGPPVGSPGNDTDWTTGTQADLPLAPGEIAQRSFARQPEILDFLAGNFGRYPFSAAGGIVDDVVGLGFALENQTRPIYSRDFFGDQVGADAVVVHELTHQWFGDNLRLNRWSDIWLNEGFATYAEWLWSEHEGTETPQQIFDNLMTIPADDPFWSLTIGDPGPDFLFEAPVYYRGGMTLHALRMAVGDDDFFNIVQTWAKRQSGKAVSTSQFIALAESISGQDLGALFDEWLFSSTKPGEAAPALATRSAAVAQVRSTSVALRVAIGGSLRR